MRHIIVSGHGGYSNNSPKDLRIPNGCSLHYYVGDGFTLYNTDARNILAALQSANPPKAFQTLDSGQFTFRYRAWYAPEFGGECAIYELDTATHTITLIETLTGAGRSLSWMFEQYGPTCTIYWLCCRNIIHGQDNLFNAPESKHVKF